MTTLVYALAVALGVWLHGAYGHRLSKRANSLLAFACCVLLAVAFLTLYPVANSHAPRTGSDDDDACNIGVMALLAGSSPYSERTYLGNVLHQLPGALALAAPFVLIGTSALQNLFWLPAFFTAVGKDTADSRMALQLFLLVMALSPTVLHQVVTGTGHLSNAIYVVLGLLWLIRSQRALPAIAWGVALASRPNFLFLIPLAFCYLRQRRGLQHAARLLAFTCATTAFITLPFFFHDPSNFGPLEAIDRVSRFDDLFPHMGAVLIRDTGAWSLYLSRQRMDAPRLFWNAALVQAFPVLAGVVLSSIQTRRLDVAYSAYGTFFAWFVLLSVALSVHAHSGLRRADHSASPLPA